MHVCICIHTCDFYVHVWQDQKSDTRDEKEVQKQKQIAAHAAKAEAKRRLSTAFNIPRDKLYYIGNLYDIYTLDRKYILHIHFPQVIHV